MCRWWRPGSAVLSSTVVTFTAFPLKFRGFTLKSNGFSVKTPMYVNSTSSAGSARRRQTTA